MFSKYLITTIMLLFIFKHKCISQNFYGYESLATGTNSFQKNANATLNCISFLPDSGNAVKIFRNNYFNINTINNNTASLYLSKNKHNLGLGVNYLSSPAISVCRAIIGSAYKLGIFKLGATVERFQYFVNEYNTAGNWTMTLSGNACLNKKINIALQINDLFPSKHLLAKNQTFMWLGFEFIPTKSINVICQINTYQNEKPNLSFSTTWKPNKYVNISFGSNNELSSYHSGIEIYIKKYSIQYALQWLPELGTSNGIGVSYNW